VYNDFVSVSVVRFMQYNNVVSLYEIAIFQHPLLFNSPDEEIYSVFEVRTVQLRGYNGTVSYGVVTASNG